MKLIINWKPTAEGETSVDASLLLETVQRQVEAGEQDGQGVTEMGLEYSWEIEEN